MELLFSNKHVRKKQPRNGEMNRESGTWKLVLRVEEAKGFFTRERLKHSCQVSRQM